MKTSLFVNLIIKNEVWISCHSMFIHLIEAWICLKHWHHFRPRYMFATSLFRTTNIKTIQRLSWWLEKNLGLWGKHIAFIFQFERFFQPQPLSLSPWNARPLVVWSASACSGHFSSGSRTQLWTKLLQLPRTSWSIWDTRWKAANQGEEIRMKRKSKKQR